MMRAASFELAENAMDIFTKEVAEQLGVLEDFEKRFKASAKRPPDWSNDEITYMPAGETGVRPANVPDRWKHYDNFLIKYRASDEEIYRFLLVRNEHTGKGILDSWEDHYGQ